MVRPPLQHTTVSDVLRESLILQIRIDFYSYGTLNLAFSKPRFPTEIPRVLLLHITKRTVRPHSSLVMALVGVLGEARTFVASDGIAFHNVRNLVFDNAHLFHPRIFSIEWAMMKLHWIAIFPNF